MAVLAYRWWAVLVVPAALLLWTLHGIVSMLRGGSSMVLHSLLLVAAMSLHLGRIPGYPWGTLFAVVFVTSLWANQFVYYAPAAFLRSFVIRNPRAYEVFNEAVYVKSVDSSDAGL